MFNKEKKNILALTFDNYPINIFIQSELFF